MVRLRGARLNWTGRGLASVSVHSDQGQVHAAIGPVSLAVQGLNREFRINIETDLHRTSLLHATRKILSSLGARVDGHIAHSALLRSCNLLDQREMRENSINMIIVHFQR